jgi:Bacterial toxin 33
MAGDSPQAQQYRRLSKGEIKKLQESGIDPHDLKPRKHSSRYDLFKDTEGNIYVMNKDGSGTPEITGVNIDSL